MYTNGVTREISTLDSGKTGSCIYECSLKNSKPMITGPILRFSVVIFFSGKSQGLEEHIFFWCTVCCREALARKQ